MDLGPAPVPKPIQAAGMHCKLKRAFAGPPNGGFTHRCLINAKQYFRRFTAMKLFLPAPAPWPDRVA